MYLELWWKKKQYLSICIFQKNSKIILICILIFKRWLQVFLLNGSCGDIEFYYFSFSNFNWRLNILQYCSGFCHTLISISLGCTYILHPEPPSQFPPHPIPQGHPSASTLRTLSHASNLDWWSLSHMIIYMFQCYSLKSSHPLEESKRLFYTSVSLFLSCI